MATRRRGRNVGPWRHSHSPAAISPRASSTRACPTRCARASSAATRRRQWSPWPSGWRASTCTPSSSCARPSTSPAPSAAGPGASSRDRDVLRCADVIEDRTADDVALGGVLMRAPRRPSHRRRRAHARPAHEPRDRRGAAHRPSRRGAVHPRHRGHPRLRPGLITPPLVLADPDRVARTAAALIETAVARVPPGRRAIWPSSSSTRRQPDRRRAIASRPAGHA